MREDGLQWVKKRKWTWWQQYQVAGNWCLKTKEFWFLSYRWGQRQPRIISLLVFYYIINTELNNFACLLTASIWTQSEVFNPEVTKNLALRRFSKRPKYLKTQKRRRVRCLFWFIWLRRIVFDKSTIRLTAQYSHVSSILINMHIRIFVLHVQLTTNRCFPLNRVVLCGLTKI